MENIGGVNIRRRSASLRFDFAKVHLFDCRLQRLLKAKSYVPELALSCRIQT